MKNKYLKLQLVATILFMFSLIINIVLVYNQILYNENKIQLIKKEDIPLIIKLNKFFVLILLFMFLYINFKNYECDILEKKDTTQDFYEIIASIFTFISGCIVLYSVTRFSNINLENPTS